MLNNYIKVALRNLLKNRLYSLINILGLTIGMTCFLVLALYIQYEFSYDQQHENTKQIYRVAKIQKGNEFRGSDRSAQSPAPLGPTLVEEFPEVKTATTLHIRKEAIAQDDKVFYQEGLFSDEKVFDVFTFPIIEGTGKEALKDPNSIILTRSMAEKYFSDKSPIGKTLFYKNDQLLTVKGVVEDLPKNQHFSFDFITSIKNLPFYDEDPVWYSNTSWYSNNYYTYVLLDEGTDYLALEKKIESIENKYSADYFRNNVKPQWFLQPLRDIHLHSQLNFEIQPNGDIRYIYLLTAIGFIILLLAAINYMNLSTVQSARRSLEVGMRKVLGARKSQLIYQFLGESFLLTLISFGIALALVNVMLPVFNRLLDQSIPFHIMGNGLLLIGMLLTAFLIGIFSGLYPAFFLSALSPAKAFKGGLLNDAKKGSILRNVLVVGQFCAAIILTIGSIVIYQQLHFIQNKKLGFNRDQIIYLPYKQEEVFQNSNTVRSQLLQHPKINKVSFGTYMPLNLNSRTTVRKWENNSAEASLGIYRNYVDYHFLDLFEMELVEGRNFSPAHLSDTAKAYILNEAALANLGWNTAVGKKFHQGQVVGVVKDFHFQPFNLAIEPQYMVIQNQQSGSRGNIALKVNMDELDQTLAFVQQTMNEIVPQAPFEYHFLDESYQNLYGFENRLARIFNIFTLLALFIASIGLFGLVANQVLQRTKEIGIRKVLGATIYNIVSMISKDFLKLVIIATIIALPVAWWSTHKWLEAFVYHIEISWWIFALAGFSTLSIALITVGIQSVNAALANPVGALKNE